MAYVRAKLAEPGAEVEIDVRASIGPPDSFQAPLSAERMKLSDAHYPTTCSTRTDDWARLDGDEHAVFGITLVRQDSLREVSSTTRRRSARTISKDASYAGRVGQGGLRRDRADVG